MLLLGFYGNLIEVLKENEKSKNQVIKNTLNSSWMVKLENNLIMVNNEFKPSLQLIKNNGNNFKILENISTNGLDSPVYMIFYKSLVYIAFYGSGGDNLGLNSGIGVYDVSKNNLDTYSIKDDSKHQFHCIDLFKIQDTKKKILISLDLIGSKLYQFNKGIFTELFHFTPIRGIIQNPRHLIQLPKTNKIIVITEKFYPRLYLLEYKDGVFIDVFSEEIILPSVERNHLTGAEIKIDPDHPNIFYISLRLYEGEFDETNVPEAIKGLLVKYKFNSEQNKFKLLTYWKVGFTPRYFTINNDCIIVTNQGKSNGSKSSLTIINKETEDIIDKIKTKNGCCFTLPLYE